MAPLRAEVSLGEVARYYRRLKELRERAEQRPVVHSLATQATMKRPAETRVLAANAFPKRSPLRPAPLPRQDNFSSPAGVVVERGDSLWKLAKRHLGSGARWRQLAALNPELPNPDRLRIGAWVRLPMGASKETKQFRVRAGDTLWKVAQSEYGTSRAWACIARANPQLPSADFILPGQVLALPLACAAAPTP